MRRFGFIHDKLEIKMLILYILSRTAAPINFAALTELTLCDDGIDYFDFAECVAELLSTDHILQEETHYSITEKGKRNGAACEGGLPYTVKLKCDANLAKLNAELRRNAQIRAEVLPREDGFYTLRLILDDENSNLFTLELLTVSTEQAEQLGARFRSQPELIYNQILQLLSAPQGPEDGTHDLGVQKKRNEDDSQSPR